ncbi:MAG TPA: ester cyclase [Verrucomicrobiae bacterium]|jgi:predicted ester cyclase|nr:ester cyclase [Verrucomicrobiae bacterium]
MTAAFNRELGLKINREVWNGRQLDKIAEYFAEDFVADYSPAFVWRGQQHVREAVERAHATFAGFREEIKTIVADDDHVVVHFTITGTHTGPWGLVPATGRPVAFDEIVIMTVRDSKVVHQTGVIDNVTGLRQVGVLPAART